MGADLQRKHLIPPSHQERAARDDATAETAWELGPGCVGSARERKDRAEAAAGESAEA